jgi:hypothetical protein
LIVCNMQPCKNPVNRIMDHYFFGKSLMCGKCARLHINWVIEEHCINPWNYFPPRFEEETKWIYQNIIETDNIKNVKIQGKEYIRFYQLTSKEKRLLRELVV